MTPEKSPDQDLVAPYLADAPLRLGSGSMVLASDDPADLASASAAVYFRVTFRLLSSSRKRHSDTPATPDALSRDSLFLVYLSTAMSILASVRPLSTTLLSRVDWSSPVRDCSSLRDFLSCFGITNEILSLKVSSSLD